MCERKERKDKSVNGGNLCGFGFGSDATMQLAEKMTGKRENSLTLQLREPRHPGENSLFIPFSSIYRDEARIIPLYKNVQHEKRKSKKLFHPYVPYV